MKFFSLENPVWKFIGNLAYFFILSCLWYLCSLPVVTAGAAASAVYYVTLKMSRDQEGELVRSFFKSFRQNLKPGCLLGVGYLAAAVVLGLDIVICLQQSSVLAGAMFFTSAVLLACAALFATMTFPLLARCDNTPGALFKMWPSSLWVSLCSGRCCWWRRGWLPTAMPLSSTAFLTNTGCPCKMYEKGERAGGRAPAFLLDQSVRR